MTDDLVIRLRTSLHAVALPRASQQLYDALDRLPLDAPVTLPGRVRHLRPMGLLAAGLAAVAFVSLAVGLGLGPRGVGPIGPSASPSASPSAAPPLSPLPTDPSFPLALMPAVIDDRAAGRIGGEQLVVSGWWTDRSRPEPCPDVPAELLIGCQDGRFGLTEGPSVGEWQGTTFVPADEPVLTPFIPATVLATPPYGPLLFADGGEQRAPVYTMFLGHFDDPRAADCPAPSRDECADRFVVDEIYFVEDPENPAPTVNPSPGAFPFDSPPPPPFAAQTCLRTWTGDQPEDPRPILDELGWIPADELPLTDDSIVPLPEAVYAIVSANEVPISLWVDDPESGERVRRWGRGVCYGWENSGTFYSAVLGTLGKVWEDGRREKIDSLFEL